MTGKKILYLGLGIVVVALLALSAPYVYLASTDFSTGYRMGVLTKFDTDGYVMRTGEGQLLLGQDSSPLAADYRTSDEFLVEKNFNPWHFSTSKSDIPDFAGLVGKRVWVRYAEHNYNISFRRTPHQALSVGEANPTWLKKPFMEIPKPFTVGRSEGTRTGRIVKASRKGKVINTYEIVVQMGEAGSQFKPLSISDDALFAYAVECLKSGVMVNVSYVDLGIAKINLNDTPYLVYSIKKL